VKGRIEFLGEDITRLSAFARARRGIVQVPEGRELFPRMTVRDNLLMGVATARSRRDVDAGLEEVFRLFPRLGERLEQSAASFPPEGPRAVGG